MVDLSRGGVGRSALAVRGLGGVLLVLGAAVLAVLGGAGAFRQAPLVHASVPAAAGPVREGSAVRYRGVVVGELAEVVPDAAGARLVLRMDPAALAAVPAAVRVRVLPKTLFGDQYVELAAPDATGPRLAAGDRVEADAGPEAVRIYAAYTRMFALLDSLRPAELQVALGTVADALRGRGAELGETIDGLHELTGRIDPARTAGRIGEVAGLADQLADAAPDLLATVDDAVALSRAVVAQRENLTELLDAGAELTERSQRFLDENGARAVRVVRTAEPVSAVLGGNADGITATLHELREFTANASRTFVDGRFQIRAPVTLDDPYPYDAADCPRYPGLDGPGCQAPAAAGGAVGPVGSAAEKAALREAFPVESTSDGGPELVGLLAGPVLRGTQVVLP
ncbi:MCE family protein [Saccharopolyspora sp. 6T]|uniref:MCE family protein n=1 Tax=Saccharopolyspora sp. 6T TaxID=2877238 RepID=UPI001CD47DE6|nr:MCE family protein [Saccharopolyspora sp. 6T]MCA1186999.1 MCE family protein [Saccharopolyspora sp. 6T]